jgi:hypothetical protein
LTIFWPTDNVVAMVKRACRGVSRGLGTALVTAALAGLLGGCSLILDFDFEADGGPPGDGGPADAFSVRDGGDECAASEPNNDLSTAAAITPNTPTALAICPAGDTDFFSFDITAGQDVTIEATFDNMGGAGDLEMRLYDGTGANIDGSMGFGNVESIERSAAMSNQLPPDTYRVEIYGFNASVQNAYTLTVTIN